MSKKFRPFSCAVAVFLLGFSLFGGSFCSRVEGAALGGLGRTQAFQIINALRLFKASAMMCVNENGDEFTKENVLKALKEYGEPHTVALGEYLEIRINGDEGWVGYDLSEELSNVRPSLAEQAGTLLLTQEDGSPYKDGKIVYMLALKGI